MRRLGLVLLVGLAVLAGAQQDKTKRVEKLQDSLTGVRSEQNRVRQKIQETRKQTRAVAADLRVVDGKLERVEGELVQTTGKLVRGRNEQQRLGSELKVTTQQLEATREQVRRRLKRMYMRGQGNLASALVGVRSAGDLASRQELLERVAKADREIFTQYQELRAKVEGQKRRQDQLVREVGTLAESQRRQRNQLDEVKDDRSRTLRSLQSQQAQLRRMLAELEADEREIASQIAAFLRGPSSGADLPRPTGRLLRPVSGRITSGFGMRMHPVLRFRRMHSGIDFGARSGTPIRAAADGIVVEARYRGGYGNTVILQHGGGLTTLYGHCSRLAVRSGQRVRRGEVIAFVGSTGLSTGPHLHFEVWVNGRRVNPMGFL